MAIKSLIALAPGVKFTSLLFLCNLRMGPKARVFVIRKPSQPSEMYHSRLFLYLLVMMKMKRCEYGLGDSIHKTSFSLQPVYEPNKLER